ncbi:MAG: response regulator transcription factor [Saprospiraceae bacterium]|jgi:DNA-binding response OmpR family regulator|nr:response regulator transcription factor [Saprospiraceae bacterium]
MQPIENTEQTKPEILFVEDDQNLGIVIRDFLKLKGFNITLALDGVEGLEKYQSQPYDICILDVNLPKMDGFQLAREIRKMNQEIPILFLTAKTMDEDKVEGFNIGADDYISKPFNIEELVLRIKVFLRRNKMLQPADRDIFKIGEYEFNHKNLSLHYKDQEKNLTQREADILKLLCQNIGSVLRREDILLKIWGQDDYFVGRSLDVFLSKLRKYLKNDPNVEIQNYHSVGFKLIIQE